MSQAPTAFMLHLYLILPMSPKNLLCSCSFSYQLSSAYSDFRRTETFSFFCLLANRILTFALHIVSCLKRSSVILNDSALRYL